MSRAWLGLVVVGGAAVLAGAAGLCALLGVRGSVAVVPEPAQPAAVPRLQSPIQLQDVTAATGIAFVHQVGPRTWYVLEPMSAGLAVFDYDGDGYEDVYLVNAGPLDGTTLEPPPQSALYRNEGGWRFTDVTAKAGVGNRGFGLGVVAADYDNDGCPDLYVSNYGPKVLYRNNGDGTFTDVTGKAGVADGHKVGAGACFLDIDLDGNLDLFVANYVEFSPDRHVMRYVGGYPRHPGPRDYPPEHASLYRNRGDGTFADVSRQSGIASHAGNGMGVVACDYNNDGCPDIFVCNDQSPSFLFRNDGRGKFEEVGLAAGVAYSPYGEANGNMGADWADYDRDGWLDVFITDFQNQLPMLFRNLGNGMFEDVTAKTGAGAASYSQVKWGEGFVDFDNDGHPDLFIACGHFDELVDQLDPSTSFRARNILLMNTGDGKFVDVTGSSGEAMAAKHSARGVAFGDFDNDGRIDVIVLNYGERPTVLRNVTQNGNHWLQVRLQGVKTNREGVGARVKVTAGELVQIDEVHCGRGYQSHWGTRLHFGLGRHERVDRIEVRWSGGGVDVFQDVPVDQCLVITEGAAGSTSHSPVSVSRMR